MKNQSFSRYHQLLTMKNYRCFKNRSESKSDRRNYRRKKEHETASGTPNIGIATHLFHKPRDVPCSGASRDSYYSSIVVGVASARYQSARTMVIAVVVEVPLHGTAISCARSDRDGANWRAKWRKPRPRFDKITRMQARTDLSRWWSTMASRRRDQPGFNGSTTWRDRSIGVVGGDRRGGKRRSACRIVASIERYSISKEFSRIKVAGGRRTGAERRSAAAI